MISRKKIAKTAATFGAAMTAMYTAPELQAQIVDLTWDSGNASATNPYVSSEGDLVQFEIDQVLSLATGASDFEQWNDTFGRTMQVGNERNILSATVVAFGQTLDPTTFTGDGSENFTGLLGRDRSFDGTGSAIVGFRSTSDNVGWFRMDFTEGGPIIYSDGEYGSGGETLIAGGTTIVDNGPVAPDTVNVFRGTVVSATLTDFAASDDTAASYRPGFTIGVFEAPVWLIFDGVAPDAAGFLVESSAGTPGLEYTVEAFNWGAGQFEEIGVQTEVFQNDQFIEFPIVAADHIDAGGEVRTRVGWRRVGFTINFPWQVNIDQVGWNQ